MSSEGSQADEASRFMKFMSRHLVVLGGAYKSRTETRAFAYSGFAMRIRDSLCWVTAGHCLKNLEDALASPEVKVFGCGFSDYFGDGATNFDRVPFEYTIGRGCYIDDATLALDYGVIVLDRITAQCLLQNGITPINRSNWEHQHQLEFELYKLLGIPEDQLISSVSTSGRIISGVRPQMIAIEQIDGSAIEGHLQSFDFIGRIPDDVKIKSVVGMSGGPIYGFRRGENGEWLYHVVAIQSCWLESERIIFGCSLPMFAERLHEVANLS